jgi:hypothetical protein
MKENHSRKTRNSKLIQENANIAIDLTSKILGENE